MPYNGEISDRFGVYTTVCCGAEIAIAEGAKFPDCPNHPKFVTKWKPTTDEPIRHVRDLPKKGDTAA